jgi:hypothetical protein
MRPSVGAGRLQGRQRNSRYRGASHFRTFNLSLDICKSLQCVVINLKFLVFISPFDCVICIQLIKAVHNIQGVSRL